VTAMFAASGNPTRMEWPSKPLNRSAAIEKRSTSAGEILFRVDRQSVESLLYSPPIPPEMPLRVQVGIRGTSHIAPAEVVELQAFGAQWSCELPRRTRSRLAMSDGRPTERLDLRSAQTSAAKDVMCRPVRRDEPPAHDFQFLAHHSPSASRRRRPSPVQQSCAGTRVESSSSVRAFLSCRWLAATP
jgi:hypothetical protein